MIRTALVALACSVLPSGVAIAQSYQGGLRGSIKDAGGVLPGVDVALANEQTSVKRSTVTNERGEYAFTSVEPGTYSVTATLQNYKTAERSGLRFGTQEFLVIDLTLEVGTIEQRVTVTGEAPLIENGTASQGTALDGAALQALPAPSRAAFTLGATVPTVLFIGSLQFTRQQDQNSSTRMSFGGGGVRTNNYTLDGVPITDISNRAVASPSIEALGDVKVQVRTYDAEIDRTGGGVFNATLRSGTNTFRGSAFFQFRPVVGAANNYFSQKAFEANGDPKNAKPDAVYYLAGGGFGGPIMKDKTFFWVSSEDYHDVLTRSVSTIFPTEAERRGDFSAVTNASGAKVTIFDPQTHLPFPGNIIPAARINPVATAIARYFPLPQSDIDNGSANYTATALIIDQFQQQYSGKIEHKLNDRVSLAGFYLYNRTNEPCGDYFTPGLNGATRFADPNDYMLQRRPQIVALNNTWVLSDSSALALRFGWTRFVDNATMTIGFDPASLQTNGRGFSQTFLDEVAQTGVPKFPNGAIFGGYSGFGAIQPSSRTYKSWGGNGNYSRLVGTHTLKLGAGYRRMGVSALNPGNSSGFFNFDREFTSSSGANNNSATDGNAFASFLLGYPSGDSARPSTMTLTTPLDIYTIYYGGYVQDDWRVSSKLTLNYGLRIEHEDGMRDVNNAITVGFDPAATNALSSFTIPASVDPTGGTSARNVTGGLMFAGANGNRTTQGDVPAVQPSPRVGVVYALNARTVVRGGYGLYWAPWSYPTPSSTSNNFGQVGFTSNTGSPQTTVTPSVDLTNPFPNPLVPPSGNLAGTLTGVGTDISFVDQHRTAPRVQQYSVDVQRDLGGGMAMTIGCIGAGGDDLSLGGSADTPVNINQLDPKYLALGAAVLGQPVPNPFFGNPAFAGTGLGTLSTQPRGQLLRPYPQFLNVFARQVSEGVSRYRAMVVEWIRRSTHGVSARVSYTYSVLKDNQIGETNGYTANGVGTPVNNYNYIASMPACTTTNFAACFNPLADYTNAIFDVPHRVIIAPTWQLPSPSSQNRLTNLLGSGWTAVAVVNLQSGFPIGVAQSDSTLLGNGQRPNVVPGVDQATTGTLADRLASADHPTAAWLNPAAFVVAPAGTWGNAPRLITDVRTPMTINTDVSVSKTTRMGGGKDVQVKLEVFNLFNRVQTFGFQSVQAGTAAFGQIASQNGFMRLTQVMFRFSW